MGDDGLRGFMREVDKNGGLDKRDSQKKDTKEKQTKRTRNLQDQGIRGYLQKLENSGEM